MTEPIDPIKFFAYKDAKVLEVTSWDGRRTMTGAVAVGKPHPFASREKQSITVTMGTCRINGKLVSEGESVEVEPGKETNMEALGPEGSSATCTFVYGDIVPMEPDVLLATLQAAKNQVCKLVRKDGTVTTRLVDAVIKSGAGGDSWVWHSANSTSSHSQESIRNFMYAVPLGKEEE